MKNQFIHDLELDNLVQLSKGEKRLSDDSPLKKWLLSLFKKAQEIDCSDIHFELQEKTFQIRMRVQGTLEVISEPPWVLGKYAVNLIKNLSNLIVTEKILPQDGRFSYHSDEAKVEYRVSSLPTHLGESLVLRLLKHDQRVRALSDLGIPQEIQEQMRKKIHRSQGLLMVTGPTGSGKTTTVYGMLQALAEDYSLKIISLEDPIEYPMPQITQIKIPPRKSHRMHEILKSTLRHDPDVLFIGEIRDPETARLAVDAALTGHLVLTTLHASTPLHGLLRLIEWGVDRYALTQVLEAVWGQQLLRTPINGETSYGLQIDSLEITDQLRSEVRTL